MSIQREVVKRMEPGSAVPSDKGTGTQMQPQTVPTEHEKKLLSSEGD